MKSLSSKRFLLILSFIFFLSGVFFYVHAVEAIVRNVGVNNFRVEIDGVVQAGFKEISGIEAETEVIEEKETDSVSLKRPGKTNYSNIVLKRGFINDPALYEWYKKVVKGVTERKSGSIIVLDRAGNEALRYNFFEAWPCRWKAPELNSKSEVEFVEEIELCVASWEQK